MPNVPRHPAKFSDPILELLRKLVPDNVSVLDPFCGVGRIFEVCPQAVGLEIEPEWAAADPRIVVGDALHPPFKVGAFEYLITSPTYANRMADKHDARERCRGCSGTGKRRGEPCQKCGGEGRRVYQRMTYKHSLGRDLHPNNSGGMQWGPAYQQFHRDAWEALLPLVTDTFILNVSDHIRSGEVVPVTLWHTDVIENLGWVLKDAFAVLTKRMKMGQNAALRVPNEWILMFKPT